MDVIVDKCGVQLVIKMKKNDYFENDYDLVYKLISRNY